MKHPWIAFLGLSLAAIAVQGIFALFEMACISLNRVRLHYLATLRFRRAVWLLAWIRNPASLFATTLIGINTSLQIGSECARQFYESLHLSPDLAPLSQCILVVLFGELIPLFGARRHPEPIAMALAPLMLVISKLLKPLIWAFSMLAQGAQWLVGQASASPFFFSREEVQKAFEGEEVEDEFNALAARVFSMKHSLVKETMASLDATHRISSQVSLEEVREQLNERFTPFVLIYHRSMQNIVAIATLRDLLTVDQKRKIVDIAKAPWFVAQDSSLLQILEQFRRNNQSVAVVLGPTGLAVGVVTFDQILDRIFGPQEAVTLEERGQIYVDRTLSGAMSVELFNQEFQMQLQHQEDETLSEWIVEHLGHPPMKGETIEIGHLELTVLEPSLRGAKLLSVTSH